MKTTTLLFFFLFFYTSIGAQVRLDGVVTDTDGNPLAFVNILINGSTNDGVTTDIDGKFKIEIDETILNLQLSYIGYESQDYKVPAGAKFLEIKMEQADYAIEDIVVIAGENPAHRIIREVVNRRSENNPEKMASFYCEVYNKLIVDFIPNKSSFDSLMAEKKLKKKKRSKMMLKRDSNMVVAMETSKRRHAMFMESVTARDFMHPDKNNERVIYNRVSGFKDPSFAAIANDFQPFTFYDDYINILNKSFLNPISPSSSKSYFFDLQDTLFQEKDTVYIISFHPRKGKTFDGLKGVLYINTQNYAIQNVLAEPYDKAFFDMKIEQKYSLINGKQWFPEQLNFELEAKKYPSPYLRMTMSGRSYIQQIALESKLDKKAFNGTAFVIEEGANMVTDSILQDYRIAPLNEKELQTYAEVDSIGEKYKFDRSLRLMEYLTIGRLPIVGPIDFQLTKLMGFNDYEKFRLGIGLITNDRLSKHFSIDGYVGYGFQDKKYKYGGGLNINILEQNDLKFRLDYKKDLNEPASLNFATQSSIVTTRFYSSIMDNWEIKTASLSGRFFDYAQIGVSLSQQNVDPNYAYRYVPNDAAVGDTSFQFTEMSINLRYAFAEKMVEMLGTKVALGTKYPILQIIYTRGIKNFLEGAYDYHKWLVSLQHNFNIRRLGQITWRIEGGWASGDLPYSKLYASSGVGRGYQNFSIFNAFQAMDDNEFLSNKFVNIFFKHRFWAPIYKTKWSQPIVSLAQNFSYGTLEDNDRHQEIEAFKTLEKSYHESGIILDNLIRFNYLNLAYIGLGIGAYLRYGEYAFPQFADNLGYRLTVDFKW